MATDKSTKEPPKNKFFKGVATWRSYDMDGDSYKHGPEQIVGVRTGKDDYAFCVKGTNYRFMRLSELKSWELV